MNENFQILFNIVCPVLTMSFGYWMGKLSHKQQREEESIELGRLRSYNIDLLKELSKEKKITKGVRDFLNPEGKE